MPQTTLPLTAIGIQGFVEDKHENVRDVQRSFQDVIDGLTRRRMLDPGNSFADAAVNIFEKATIIRPLLYRLPWSEIKVLFLVAATDIRSDFDRHSYLRQVIQTRSHQHGGLVSSALDFGMPAPPRPGRQRWRAAFCRRFFTQ